jgi:peroxiredoxin
MCPVYVQLTPGDPIQPFKARTPDISSFSFDAVAGIPCILMFFGSGNHPAARPWLEALLAVSAEFDGSKRAAFGVSVDAGDFGPGGLKDPPGMRFFHDVDGSISRRFGALPRDDDGGVGGELRLFSLVLDARQRVVEVIPRGDDPRGHIARALACLHALEPADCAGSDDMPAPVLTVPRVFEPQLCQRLIAFYRERGGEESGFMRELQGRTVGVYDHGFKRRKDCLIDDQQLLDQCRERLRRRLVPAVKQAFQFDATRIERWIVARYDGNDAGFFRAHRDNTTGGTAHRQFAVSIHLDREAFTGGGVRFPEFGPRVYNPPTGGALVFSCSLLHEALPVASGERFVFLPFLYGEEAARLRQQNQVLLAGDINTPDDA